MIKFTASGPSGRTLIGLGLSARNIERMKAGKLIHLNLEELNLHWKADIMLLYGETEQEIATELKEFIGPDTIVHHNEKRKAKP